LSKANVDRLKLNLTCCFCGCLLFFFLSPLVRAQEDYKNLKKQANEIGEAYAREDFERVVDLTYPKLVKLIGGRDKMIALLRQEVANMRKEGLRMLAQSAASPTQFLRIGKQLFAVIPVKLQFKVPVGVGVEESCMIGVSGDSGEHWTFVDGSGDQQRLKTLFPTAADKLKLPPPKKPVVIYDTESPKKP
jgi:hypothetical protein